MYVCIVYIYIYVCVYVYIYIYIYIYIYTYIYLLVLSKLTQINFNGTNFFNAARISGLTRGPTRSWRNGDAQC